MITTKPTKRRSGPLKRTEAQLASANQVLSSFVNVRIEPRRGGMYVCWTRGSEEIAKRWQCRWNDFYPVWNHHYPGGGTSVTALSQLIRWLQEKPVLPIASWRYWASETCKLLPLEAVDELSAAGYPEQVDCVLCHQPIIGGLDWWSLDGVTGPCCGWTSGCRQTGESP